MTLARDLAGILASVALPWLAGTLLVVALGRRAGPARWLHGAGYGYVAGAFAATALMRALSAAGVHWSVATLALPLLALTGLLAWAARAAVAPAALRADLAAAAGGFGRLTAFQRGVFVACLALVAIRLAGLALEVAWRPLLAWDSWTQWATKARVWFEFGWMAPFVSQQEWFATTDPMRFVDMHPNYPATVPLLQAWTGFFVGRWDESLVNAPWVMIAVALGLAFYGGLRRAGEPAHRAMLFSYLLLSLPLLDIHVALAGTADLFLGTTHGLAAIALWQWARTRERGDLALAVAMALVSTTIKVEGLLWALTLLPPAIVVLHRRIGLALVVALGADALLYVAFGPAELTLFGYVLRTRFTNVTLPVAQHLFVMDNWHLLWYAAFALPALRWRRLFAPDFAPMTVTMLGGFGLVFVVFYLSSAAGGVDDETLVNRMLLQIVPALMFYLALLLRPAPAPAAGATRRSSQLQAKAADA